MAWIYLSYYLLVGNVGTVALHMTLATNTI